jgi:uncharacterized protein (TIGR02453 family)
VGGKQIKPRAPGAPADAGPGQARSLGVTRRFGVWSRDMSRATVAQPARFTGFADRDGRFFRALARNQRRDWYAAHRQEYEDGWQAPMKALLAEVRERIDPLFPNHPLSPPKVFRIYRDVRFSKDKSPYKTHIGGYIAIDETGEGPAATAPLYFHVAADEVFVASGQYVMDGAQLARFRAAVLDDRRGGELAAILKKLGRAGFAVGSSETLQRIPRGLDPGHPRADLLRRKGLIATFPALPRALLVSRELVTWLVSHTKRVVPLVEWLAFLGE